jgi:hypothetical protein
MMRLIPSTALLLCLGAAGVAAQEVGTASGTGTIERFAPGSDAPERVSFAPRHAFAYSEGAGATKSTWIVLTDKTPPVKEWAAAKDRAEARRSWCEKEQASFVALKLDASWAVDLYFLCPANGRVNTEMLSSANGLDSIAVQLETRDDRRLKGRLRTGQGSCPGADGGQAYCTPTGDFAFNAPVST